MEYLGIKNKAYTWWSGREWVDYKPYVSCPCADVDNQMECIKYEPCDTSEWLCVHCECGQSDVCDLGKKRSVEKIKGEICKKQYI